MYPADDALEFLEYETDCDHDFTVKVAILGYIGPDLCCLMLSACSKCGTVNVGQE